MSIDEILMLPAFGAPVVIIFSLILMAISIPIEKVMKSAKSHRVK